MIVRTIMLLLLLFLMQPAFAQDIGYKVLSSTYDYKGMPVDYKIAVWYPADGKASATAYKIGPSQIKTNLALDASVAGGQFPIVFYSHGATGAGTSSFFMCELLAQNGYIVVAPDYLDMVCVARIDEAIPFDNPIRMRANQYIDWLRGYGLNKMAVSERKLFEYRPKQLKQVVELMWKENHNDQSPFFGHVDELHVGLVGHSFGAWTSLLAAGADANFNCSIAGEHGPVFPVGAVVALSGPVNENIYCVNSKNDLQSVKVPVLFEYGQKEPALGRQDDKALLFDKANSPKVLINIKDADHLSFSGGVKGEYPTASDYRDKDAIRRTISETTLDFFDAFLKDNKEKKSAIVHERPGVVSVSSSL